MTARDRLVELACRLQEITKSPNCPLTKTKGADRPARSVVEQTREGRP
jgi:hypothetical protein